MHHTGPLQQRRHAFTLLEAVIVIALIAIVTLFLLPPIAGKGTPEGRGVTRCVSTLKQIYNAMAMFQSDHEGKLPLQVSTNSGGTMEYLSGAYAPNRATVETFLALRMEIRNPRMIACPTAKIERVQRWEEIKSVHVAYFMEPTPLPNNTNAILAGDANLLGNGKKLPLLIDFNSSTGYQWGKALHSKPSKSQRGTLLFVDGSISYPGQMDLKNKIKRSLQDHSIKIPSS